MKILDEKFWIKICFLNYIGCNGLNWCSIVVIVLFGIIDFMCICVIFGSY